MGIVYHANYLVWCEIGRTEYMRAAGVAYSDLERTGMILVVADARVRYHAGAQYDDVIRIDTTLSAVRSRAIAFDYIVSNANTGERLVTAHTTLVCLDGRRKAVLLPPTLRAALEALG